MQTTLRCWRFSGHEGEGGWVGQSRGRVMALLRVLGSPCIGLARRCSVTSGAHVSPRFPALAHHSAWARDDEHASGAGGVYRYQAESTVVGSACWVHIHTRDAPSWASLCIWA